MNIMSTEIVFRGHPDKLADQISDSILMEYLKIDEHARVNVNVVGGANTVFISGEAYSSNHINIDEVVKDVLADVECCPDADIVNEVIQAKPEEFQDVPINLVDLENIFYGYACNETEELLPKGMVILQNIAKEYESLRKTDKRFLSDGKVIMEGLYNEQGDLIKIISMGINHQNTGKDIEDINEIMRELVLSVTSKYNIEIDSLTLNPYGPYLVGGFDRDTGLTGRKLDIDSYQRYNPTTRMALSGRDIYSIRSAAYKAREIAKNILTEKGANWVSVEIAYGGTSSTETPVQIKIESDKGKLNAPDSLYYECIPENILEDLNLLKENLVDLSSFGHIQK